MYVVIKNSTKSKSYMTTDDCNKPYIVLKDGSRTPLTTNTTNGLYINVKSSSSHSESASYLTSDTESSGMSSVTALTSEVVDTYYSSKADSAGLSSTTALTRESTSGYLTRSSTSGYLTRSSTSGYETKGVGNTYAIYYSQTWNNGGSRVSYTYSGITSSSYYYRGYAYMTLYGNLISITNTNYGYQSDSYVTESIGFGPLYIASGYFTNNNIITTSTTYYYNGSVTQSWSKLVETQTTKTLTRSSTYSTLTRSSTYSTLTCESTSGYSGVSSSSSESTSGYTGYSSSETTVINSAIMRPKEYNSASASESYYTSALSPDGMSSTTALTSEVVDTYYSSKADSAGLSSTTALTRASTSGYGTDGYKVVEVTRSYKTDIQSITGGPGGTSAYNNHQTVYNKEMLLVNKNNSLYYSTNKSFSSAEAYGTMGHDTGYTTDLKNNRSYSQECMYRTVTALTSSTYSAYAASNFYYSISQTATMRTSESSVTTATYTRSSTSGYSGVSSSTSEATTGYSGVSSSSYTSAAWEED